MLRPPTVIFILVSVFLGWSWMMQRSTTVTLQDTDYSLTYRVAWGFGMKERLMLGKTEAPWSLASSQWVEIWKKPYNSGAVLYVSNDGQTFYIGTYYKLGIAMPDSKRLVMTCDKADIPKLTQLGRHISASQDFEQVKIIDPEGQSFPSYIEADVPGRTTTGPPTPSKYYIDLQYIGRFGVVRGKSRGKDVRFVSSDNAPEPQMSLNVHCG